MVEEFEALREPLFLSHSSLNNDKTCKLGAGLPQADPHPQVQLRTLLLEAWSVAQQNRCQARKAVSGSELTAHGSPPHTYTHKGFRARQCLRSTILGTESHL